MVNVFLSHLTQGPLAVGIHTGTPAIGIIVLLLLKPCMQRKILWLGLAVTSNTEWTMLQILDSTKNNNFSYKISDF